MGRVYRRLTGKAYGFDAMDKDGPSSDNAEADPHHATEGPHPIPQRRSVEASLAGPLPKLERLTSSALNGLIAAAEQARTLRHRTVGTEHLLLALALDAESGAFRMMQRMGANPETIVNDTLRALVPGAMPAPDRPALSPRARLAVELANRASARIGVASTGTEHLLIGLAAESEGIAAKALYKSGIVARVAESHVIAELDGKVPGDL
jgi:ATP-dependent Clp protease ATP-binding subunit ClpA